MLLHLANSRPSASAKAVYLKLGEGMVNDLAGVLERNGKSLNAVTSILDFACGYGRVIRFLAQILDPERVTGSDIDPAAVDFARRTFGVSGFCSTREAGLLYEPRKYEVIFVASLFSHLTIAHWQAWAHKLASMLQPRGLLIFSTHGLWLCDNRNAKELADGFFYYPGNETRGRLANDYYGTAYVDEAYVRRVFASNEGHSELIDVLPRGLAAAQDVYVVRRQKDNEQ